MKAFKALIQRIIFGQAIRGEPITNKPKKHTVMPCDMTLLQWYRGGWVHFLNNKK